MDVCVPQTAFHPTCIHRDTHMRAHTHMSDGSHEHPMWPEASVPLRHEDLMTSGWGSVD